MENTRNKKSMHIEDDNTDIEKVIRIDRVNKVVKGGKRLAFRAIVVTGDQNGSVGFGLGKSKEVPTAIRKAIERSKKNRKKVNIVEGTIPHPVVGKFGSSSVVLRPAKPGTGVIAGGPVRILLEALGIRNVVAKTNGSGNAINTLHATLNGLLLCKDLKEAEKIRGKKLPVFFVKDESTFVKPRTEENRMNKPFSSSKKDRPSRRFNDNKSANVNKQENTVADKVKK